MANNYQSKIFMSISVDQNYNRVTDIIVINYETFRTYAYYEYLIILSYD